ncbi:MAG: hypothetical protein NTX76_00155 [Alphaproteobacteria bacterium]|nr:hypothetical protein [Alphaproteobacteria bacterium]
MNTSKNDDHNTGQYKGLSGAVYHFLQIYFDQHNGLLPVNNLYHTIIHEVEKPLIEITLKAVCGNQKKAAEVLGINRNTLRKKIQELGLDKKTL